MESKIQKIFLPVRDEEDFFCPCKCRMIINSTFKSLTPVAINEMLIMYNCIACVFFSFYLNFNQTARH